MNVRALGVAYVIPFRIPGFRIFAQQLHCITLSVCWPGLPGLGCVCAGGSFRGLQRVPVRLRPNGVWQDVHHDGHAGEDHHF